MFATVAVSWSALFDAWLPPIPAPPDHAYPERVYELTWAHQLGEGPVPGALSIGAVAGEYARVLLWPVPRTWRDRPAMPRTGLADGVGRVVDWEEGVRRSPGDHLVHSVGLMLHAAADLTAREAMTLWLDRVNFGDGTYGIESAAWRFYDRPVEELDDAEIALLVGKTSMPWRAHEDRWHRSAIAILERAGRPVPEWVWLGALRPFECHEL